MKRLAATQISHLCSALLLAGMLLNLNVTPPASFFRMAAQPQTEAESFAGVSGRAHSHTLTTALRAHSEVPAARQKRVRHPALDLTALPPESFQLLSFSLGRGALDNQPIVFHSSFSVRPQGRAPPISV